MKFFCLVLLLLALSLATASETRFETRRYKKPEEYTTWSQVTYSIPARKTIHGEDTETLFHVLKAKGHVNEEELQVRDLSEGLIFNIEPPTCCSFISPGTRVTEPFDFIIDPTNPHSLTADKILEIFNRGVSSWESQAQSQLVTSVSLGDIPFSTDVNHPDGLDTAFFAEISEPGVIAFAATHGQFSGNDRRIFEADIVWNTQVPLGIASSNPDTFDFETVTIHEQGHTFGLGHPPVLPECQDEVMFASLARGVVKALTGEDGQCIASLYDAVIIAAEGAASLLSASVLSVFSFLLIN